MSKFYNKVLKVRFNSIIFVTKKYLLALNSQPDAIISFSRTFYKDTCFV